MSPTRRLPPDFSRSAAYPLYAFDPAEDLAWVLHFDPDDYRRAAFLDQRAVRHREISGWRVQRSELDAALDSPPRLGDVHWLFHIGHCGSSLVSRVLDLIPGVLGLREPLPLLTLAHGRDDAATSSWQAPVLAMLGRGFAGTRAVVVKPTSVVTVLADRLLPHTGRACLLWVDLQTWLATMLRDAELGSGVFATEPLRLSGNDLPPASSDAQRLARAWLAEQLRWRRLAMDPQFGPRLLDLDFAQVLADPGPVTARLAAHYGLQVPADWAQRIKASELLSRYSKDGGAHFDANARRRELEAAAQKHASAIVDGMDWARAALASIDAPGLAERLQPRA